MKIKHVAVVFATLVSVSSGLAWAQPANRWTTNCSTDRMTDKKACNVTIMIDPGKRPDDLLAVQVTVASGAIGIVGGRYGSGARIRVDGNPAVSMTGCERSICILLPKQAAAVVKQMRNGSKLLVEFTTVQGQTIGPWEVSLSGFDAEYQRASGS